MSFQASVVTLPFGGVGAAATCSTITSLGSFQSTGPASCARVWVEGAFTGIGTFQESYDGGATWYACSYCIADAAPGAYTNTVIASGSFTILLIGITNLRLLVTGAGTGAANVSFVLLSTAPSLGIASGSGGGGGGGGGTGGVVTVSGPVNIGTLPSITLGSRGGAGSLQPVPNGSANGAPLGVLPAGASGFTLYLQQGDSVSGTFSSTAPSGPPASTVAYIGPNGPNPSTEFLAGSNMFYITATSGNPQFRWV